MTTRDMINETLQRFSDGSMRVVSVFDRSTEQRVTGEVKSHDSDNCKVLLATRTGLRWVAYQNR